MNVYKKMVQASPRNDLWCEYPDGHLEIKIFYSGDYRNKLPTWKPYCIFSIWGRDDFGMEINEYVADDNEANKLVSKWLKIYHDMPKHLTVEWLLNNGFDYA